MNQSTVSAAVSALFAACLIEVNKKVDGKYAKVGDVTIHVPTLDCFGITAEQAKDKDGAPLVDDGLPVYTTDKAN